MKKIVSLFMVLCMLLGTTGLAFGEAEADIRLNVNFPVVDQPLTVKIAVEPNGSAIDFDPAQNWMCQYLERTSGLTIEWQVIDPATSTERIPMILNSGDMPDAILGHWFSSEEVVKYGASEQLFYPINELTDYTPVLNQYFAEEPAVKAGLTTLDGNIYGFPAICNVYNYPQRFWINSEWLAAANLEAPKTLAELKDMLVAFRDLDVDGDGDAANETPWAISWSDIQSERRVVLNAYGYVATDDNYLAIDYSDPTNPEMIYVPLAENYKSYVTYMNDLWNEGLLDMDMMTRTDVQVQAAVLEGSVGFTGMNDPKTYDPEGYEKWICLDVLVDNESDTPVFTRPNQIYSPAMMVINAECDENKAAALARLADAMFTLEWYGYAVYGPEAGSEYDWFNTGHYYPEVAEGEPKPVNVNYNRAEGITSDWVHRVTYLTIGNLPGFNLQGYDPYKVLYAETYPESAIGKLFADGVVYDEFLQQMIDKQSPYYVDGVPAFFTSVEDMERLAELKTPLDDYVANQEAKFITGELSIEKDWDAFMETLKQYGAQEYQDIYTKYYEQYKLNK